MLASAIGGTWASAVPVSETRKRADQARTTSTFVASPAFAAAVRDQIWQHDGPLARLRRDRASGLHARGRARALGPACGTSRTRPPPSVRESRCKLGRPAPKGIGRDPQFGRGGYRSWPASPSVACGLRGARSVGAIRSGKALSARSEVEPAAVAALCRERVGRVLPSAERALDALRPHLPLSVAPREPEALSQPDAGL
jgi:hypothetical protein